MVYVVHFFDGTEHEVEGDTMTEVLAKISELISVTGRENSDLKDFKRKES
jgi:hypothetical protein